MELFQNLLNKVRQGYGQIDKNKFGGLLPGGAATPIGSVFQKFVDSQQPNPTQRRAASVLDAAASAIANTQPVVERTIKNAPVPVRSAISSGLNTLPFGVNLFGRYFTGLGNEGLQVPRSITSEIKESLKKFNRPQAIKEAKSSVESFGSMLNAIKAGTYKAPLFSSGITPKTQVLNDNLAQIKSNIKRMEKGDIPYDPYSSSRNQNPLTSPITSVGSAWFSQIPGGYQSQETYDFTYGGADRYAEPSQEPLTPSQLNALFATTGASPAVYAPVTEFGRAIVSKIKPNAFNYTIKIR